TLLYDLARGKQYRPLEPGGKDEIQSILFSPDSSLMVVDHPGHALSLWGWEGPKKLFEFDAAEWVYSPSFSPDGRTLAAILETPPKGGSVTLWDVSNGRKLRSLADQGGRIAHFAFSADGKTLVTEHYCDVGSPTEKGDGPVWEVRAHVWEVATGRQL